MSKQKEARMAEAPKRSPGQSQAAKRSGKRAGSQNLLLFGKRNVLLLVAGIVVIAVGYLLLGRGSITAAPILLVSGYCVIVPLSITLWVKKPEDLKRSEGTRPSGAGE